MINVYLDSTPGELITITKENTALLSQALYIDLFNPTPTEEQWVETQIGINVPTPEEMREIEFSSRLYRENDILFMTVLVIAHSDSPNPKLDPITFILTNKQLINIRYIEAQSFNLFFSRIKKIALLNYPASHLLIEFLDAAIDRLADILELIGHNLDKSSQTILKTRTDEKPERLNYRHFLQHIGNHGDLNSKTRESLITFNRLISFFSQIKTEKLTTDLQTRLTTFAKDVDSLSKHADFLSTKVNFLLEATLGMVNIEQNNTIKIVSVAAVIFLPPTLVASIYGMNFKHMPELMWKWGYPLAIALIILGAWLPYKFFKRKKWL